MSLAFCVLGSGSSGNCTLVTLHGRTPPRHILIDAGLSPRQTAARLGPLGVSPKDLCDILLTHVDHDHFHPGWSGRAPRLEATWRAHRRHLGLTGLPTRRAEPFEGTFELGPGTLIETTLLPHDQLGTTGFVIDHHGVRLGYATDMGRVPATLPPRLRNLAALAIESNYDRQMQLTSDRPAALKRRIMGGLGHLSNEQALDAVLQVVERGDLRHIALLHLSRHCNDPRIVRRLYAERAPHLLHRLTITNQHEPTPLLHVEGPEAGRPPAVEAGRQLNFLEAMPGP
ncbi:MAG: MBL fold metallo-hydrolase [Planctomycetota bacterium]|jgi:phosphoribosyl 1,2-cyclic phosphodiesterase